jgi:hypothetical protein
MMMIDFFLERICLYVGKRKRTRAHSVLVGERSSLLSN